MQAEAPQLLYRYALRTVITLVVANDFENPNALGREYQDATYAVEHFHTKLLKLASGFKTCEGARLGAERHARLEAYLADFMEEVGLSGPVCDHLP